MDAKRQIVDANNLLELV